MRLKPLLEEVGEGLGLSRDGKIAWIVDVDDQLLIDADHEHLFRVLSNLTRNAVQAIESKGDHDKSDEIQAKAWRDGRRVFIEISDTGPGVPVRARNTVPPLPRHDPKGRIRSRARHRIGADRRARGQARTGRHRSRGDFPDRDPRPGRALRFRYSFFCLSPH